jgi:hypothetical protein
MAYPNWDEQTMRKRTHRRLLMLSGLAVILWIALIGWIFWWLLLPDQPAAANPAKLTDLLAALTIVAVLIERVLETGFRIVQGVWHPAVAYYSHGMRWLKATETEESEAREWLQNVSTFYNNLRSAYNRRLRDLLAGTLKIDPLAPVPEQAFAHMDDLKKEAEFRLDAAKAMVDDAQQHLDEAETKLDSMMCHPRYRGAKAVVAIIVGPLLGVTLAAIGRWSMLAAAGLTDVPPRMDIFVTGLVLGTSSLPAHAAITNVGELISRIGGGGGDKKS